MKQVVFIMGSYGSGKSTYYDTLLSDKFKDDFIHIDISARLKEKIESIGIQHIATQLNNDEVINDIQIAIANSKDIIIETTFASTYSFEDVTILDELKKNGYSVEGYFLYTDDVEKNINNKMLSYLRGDSIFVDDDTITRHYNKSLENIEKNSGKFDKLHLIDNSDFEMETKDILENKKIENIEKYFGENQDENNQEQKSTNKNRFSNN